MMVLGRDAAAALGLLSLLGTAAPAHALPTCPRRGASPSPSSPTSLRNMLRDIADSNSPSWDPSFRSERSGASSSNWRKNQGYNLSRPTPPEMGGTYSNPLRDAETNPYYDPGWAQSIRRDNPSQNFGSLSSYNGYNDPYNHERFGGSRSWQYPSTYPGMQSPRKTDRYYSNPVAPYYDPVWSQSYARREDPIRDDDHTMYYAPGYDKRGVWPYYDGMGMGGGGYRGYGPGMGPGRGMFAVPQSGGKRKAVLNGNSLMRAKKSTLFHSDTVAPQAKITALRMSFYDGPEWQGGPMFDPMMRPPPGYGREMRPGGDYGGVTTGSGGPFGANQMNPSYYRRGGGSGFRRPGRNGPGMVGPPGRGGGIDPFVRPESLRDSEVMWSGPFGRDDAVGRISLKDMASRKTKSYDAQVISNMNSRSNSRAGMGSDSASAGAGAGGAGRGGGGVGAQQSVGPMGGGQRSMGPMGGGLRGMGPMGGEQRGMGPMGGGQRTMGPMGGEQRTMGAMGGAALRGPGPMGPAASMSSQYVPLSSTYGPPEMRSPPMERSPPLSVGPPPPEPVSRDPYIDTGATAAAPPTVRAARLVRQSVVLVTSEGVRKENSQGSGFVVAFNDPGDDDDVEEKDRAHILTSAHVAPPGWKVSVTFPGDPDKQYPATVVGRKLNSDLAVLCVETAIDDGDDYPFPPPLILSADDISTETSFRSSIGDPSTSEIGSPVYAFGYPMGVAGPTMTSGIVSATTRGINYMDAPVEGEEPSEISKGRPFEKTSFVITDAAMAGGMSGGPLVNAEGVVLGINALVRPDLRALGNYAVSGVECETFLERLEDKRGGGSRRSADSAVSRQRRGDEGVEPRKSADADVSPSSDEEDNSGVAGYRVMLYGYSTDKSDAQKTLRRVAGLDELRAENAMRSAYSFGAGVVDEFYVAETRGNRERAVRAARKSADDLEEKLKKEGMMVDVEPLNLLK